MRKFKNAFTGLKVALKDKAILLQVFLAILTIIGGVIIKLDYYEWLIYVLCIVLVIAFEIINSVIEKLCNIYTDKFDIRIKIIKDMASSAVLLCAIGALIICALSVIKRII